jgi:hypothetical protein
MLKNIATLASAALISMTLGFGSAPARAETPPAPALSPTESMPYGPDGPRITNDPPPPASEEAQRESEAMRERLQAEASAAAPRSI